MVTSNGVVDLGQLGVMRNICLSSLGANLVQFFRECFLDAL
eukprot:COSAG03_NODE_461_length_7711_cov_2.201787_2_plen_41_part_00